MKKFPLILSIFATNLIWSSPQKAMEEHVVLDRRNAPDDGRPQILVLTETGRRKAEFLQESYDQQKEREYLPFHPESLDDDPEMQEAIRLSLGGQTLTLTPSPTLSSAHEENDDPLLKQALSESSRDHESQQKKIAEEKEALEKERLQKRRDEIIKALQEEANSRSAEKELIFSEIQGLQDQAWHIRKEFMPDANEPSESFLSMLNIRDEEAEKIDDQIVSLKTYRSSFQEIDNLIQEEIIYLIRGGDPRDLPWMQQLSFAQQAPLLSSSSGSLPSIPSSALPNFNSESPDKK
jgi:hypothetical protein